MKFEELQGLTIKGISGLVVGSEQVDFTTTCGRKFRLYHRGDCCERVSIVDVSGDESALVGQMIVLARESSSKEEKYVDPSNERVKQLNQIVPQFDDSNTWTFYTLATVKGWVDIRWFGSSNGYYSEEVTFEEVK